ncbi:hypothetical protein YTPLAS18_21970 [Nitrospira sp.]|nr:hypothetical protein YTPLAS18_21970 [Nitrospira sp.]
MLRSLMSKLAMLLVSAFAVTAILSQRPPLPLVPEDTVVSPEPMIITATVSPEPPPQQVVTQPSTTVGDSTPSRLRTLEGSGAAHGQPQFSANQARLDLNRATQHQFERLPGIGPGLARQLVAYRMAHGRFTSVEELRAVKGIGAKRYARVAPLVTVSAAPGPAPSRLMLPQDSHDS